MIASFVLLGISVEFIVGSYFRPVKQQEMLIRDFTLTLLETPSFREGGCGKSSSQPFQDQFF